MQRVNSGLSTYKPYTGNQVVGGSENSSGAGIFYGRVLDVIQDLSDSRSKGNSQTLYGLYFQPLFEDETDKVESSEFAYCGVGAGSIKQIPVRGEIVKIETKVAADAAEEVGRSNMYFKKYYWTEIVPVWNHPHLNNYPDTVYKEHIGDFGGNFEENGQIKPLQLAAGDTAFEGRYGQSIRMGGTTSKLSPIATSDTNGSPYTIIRNGQAPTSGATSFEDVNKDDTSIYLTSNHKVPITEANRKFKGAKEVPALASTYQGKQAVVNSGRVVINAKEENVAIASKKHSSVNANSVSIDGEKYIGLDAPKIYLGSAAQGEREPVLKGTTTEQLLLDLGNALTTWCTTLAESLTAGAAIDPPLAAGAQATVAAATQLKALLNAGRTGALKSKKVYTE